MNPPGQGQSRSARRRRNRRNNNNITATTTTTITPASGQTQTSNNRRGTGRRQRQRRRNGGSSGGSRGNDLYNRSLQNPDVSGAKVPDLTAIPTGTFMQSNEFAITTTGDGVYSIAVQPGSYGGVYWTTASSAASVITYGGATGFPSAPTVQGLYNFVRPVSGYIDVEFIGSTSNDQGQCCAYIFKPNANGTVTPTGVGSLLVPNTFAGATSMAYSNTYPLRNGLRILYRPFDNSDFEFQRSDVASTLAFPPIMGIFISGAANTAQVARVRMHFNYEGIPRADTTSFVQASSSPIDLSALSQAMKWGQEAAGKIVPLFGGWNGALNAATSLASSMISNRLRNARSRPPAIDYSLD